VVGCHLGAGIEKGQCPSAISGCESHAGIHRQVLECRIKFITNIVDCEICVIIQKGSISIDNRKGIIMNEKRSFKKRLAGLLAMSLVLAMMMGMTVNATGMTYYVKCNDEAKGAYEVMGYTFYAYTLCTDDTCETPANVSELSDGDEIKHTISGSLKIILDGIQQVELSDIASYSVSGGPYEFVGIEKEDDSKGILTLRTPAPAVAQQQTSCSHGGVETKVIKEPTETEDGIIGYYCTGCGGLLSTDSTSSYAYFLKTIIDKINKAEPGSTVEISSKIWNSLSQDVMLAMAARRDINVVMTFRYQHEDYQYIIPAGTAIDTADKYYGPMYLGQLYGMTKLEK